MFIIICWNFMFCYCCFIIWTRVAIGSDRKQFFPSDPTKNKNESDPIRQKILNLKRIGFSKIFASASAIGSDFRPKMLPSAPNRRTSDGLPIRRGHPNLNMHCLQIIHHNIIQHVDIKNKFCVLMWNHCVICKFFLN